jgi:hypothetical protein
MRNWMFQYGVLLGLTRKMTDKFAADITLKNR